MNTDDGKSETRAALAQEHNAKFARKVGLEAPQQGEGPKAGPPAFTSDDERSGEGPDIDNDADSDDSDPSRDIPNTQNMLGPISLTPGRIRT
jgi:hypothetical protein